MEKLRKCSFCGGEAYFRTDTSGYRNDMRLIGFQIECRNCHTSYPKRYKVEVKLNENGEIETTNDERPKAIKAWNRRCCD